MGVVLVLKYQVDVDSHGQHPESVRGHEPMTGKSVSEPFSCMKVRATHIWTRNACAWQPAPSSLSTKDLAINVATLVARLPKVAKKARRLIGL